MDLCCKVPWKILMDERSSVGHGLKGVEQNRQLLIVHLDERERFLSGLSVHSSHGGNLIADVSNLVDAKNSFIISRRADPVFDSACIFVRNDSFHTWKPLRL